MEKGEWARKMPEALEDMMRRGSQPPPGVIMPQPGSNVIKGSEREPSQLPSSSQPLRRLKCFRRVHEVVLPKLPETLRPSAFSRKASATVPDIANETRPTPSIFDDATDITNEMLVVTATEGKTEDTYEIDRLASLRSMGTDGDGAEFEDDSTMSIAKLDASSHFLNPSRWQKRHGKGQSIAQGSRKHVQQNLVDVRAPIMEACIEDLWTQSQANRRKVFEDLDVELQLSALRIIVRTPNKQRTEGQIMKICSFLGALPMLRDMPQIVIRAAARCIEVRRFDEGTLLWPEVDKVEGLYILLRGCIGVTGAAHFYGSLARGAMVDDCFHATRMHVVGCRELLSNHHVLPGGVKRKAKIECDARVVTTTEVLFAPAAGIIAAYERAQMQDRIATLRDLFPPGDPRHTEDPTMRSVVRRDGISLEIQELVGVCDVPRFYKFTQKGEPPNPKTAIIYFLLDGRVERKGTRELVQRKEMMGEEALEKGLVYPDEIRSLTENVRVLWILAQDYKQHFQNPTLIPKIDVVQNGARTQPDRKVNKAEGKVVPGRQKKKQAVKRRKSDDENQGGDDSGARVEERRTICDENQGNESQEHDSKKNEHVRAVPKMLISEIAQRLRQATDKNALIQATARPRAKLPPGSEHAEENTMGALPKVLNARSSPPAVLREPIHGLDVLDARVDHTIASASTALRGSGTRIVAATPGRLPPFAAKLPALPTRPLPAVPPRQGLQPHSARTSCRVSDAERESSRPMPQPPHTSR